MSLRLLVLLSAALMAAGALPAQERYWIQIEAHETLREGQEAARGFAATLDDIAGVRLQSGWYAVVLGPYDEDAAFDRRNALRRQGVIPRDTFVTAGERFVRQYWPAGGDALSAAPGSVVAPDEGEPEASEAEPEPPREETLAEARRSERAMGREARREIQRALEWEGHYTARIDADFGPATRRAMRAWQAAAGVEVTGVLTTRQRTRLLEAYRTTLARLDLREIVDDRAGIRIRMPMGLVRFAAYQPPFVRYDSRGESGVRALLISREGGRSALSGLFEVMQTLDIVPLTGDRRRSPSAFTLTGQNDSIHSYTHARLVDGAIKGFTLIWPPDQADMMTRVAALMRESLGSTGADALAPASGRESLGIDLLAGVSVRQPDFAQSGFYVDGQGAVATGVRVAGACERITLEGSIAANLAAGGAEVGVALLTPTERLAPSDWARLSPRAPETGSRIAVAGFAYGGALDAPVLTFGNFAAETGLSGEADRYRLSLPATEGEIGGPVLGPDGTVAGMLLPGGDDARRLPDGVHFALPAGPILSAMESAGLSPSRAGGGEAAITPEALTRRARAMTVLVECWN